MPTGYTYKIEEGISFQEYALQCARAFGACISMRDEPSDTPIPEKFEESSYYSKEVEKIKKKLEQLELLSEKELQEIIDNEYGDEIKNKQKQITKCKMLKKKYDKMLEEIIRWTPPSIEHFELKHFMRNQINISYSDCDCEYWENKKIIKLSVEQYRNEKKKELSKDLDYYMYNWKEETERVAKRNLWIKQLRDSLEDYK